MDSTERPMMKVLIVDDSAEGLVIAKACLAKEDLEVICAENGELGLQRVRQDQPDLVLLDVSMPDMSGFEVCRILKSDPELHAIPVMFLTSSDDNQSRVTGLDTGGTDYITKPFDGFELRARVRAALRTKSLQDQLAALNQTLESRVEERTAEVNQLLRQKDAFVNQLSHDLKTPLTPLVALLPVVAERVKDAEARKILDLLTESVGYMRNLVEMTLQLARLNSSSVRLKAESVDLSAETGRILDGLRTVFQQRRITAVNNVTTPVAVQADRVWLRELFDNVIGNAAKFTEAGGTVTVNARTVDDTVEVTVRDTGVGMTAAQLARVFEEFYKADDSRHDCSSTGLGLAICRRIVERHGGSIRAESAGLGCGTTVYFTLPAGQDPPRQAESSTPQEVAQAGVQ